MRRPHSRSEKFLEGEIVSYYVARFYHLFYLQKVLPVLVNIFRGLPLISAVPAIYYGGDNETLVQPGVFIFFVIHLILACIGAFAGTGAKEPKLWEKIAR